MPTARKRLIYVGLALSVLFCGDWTLRRYERWSDTFTARIEKLQKSYDDTENDLLNTSDAIVVMEDLQRRSLPRDLELARSEYRRWLMRLVQSANLQNPAVDPGEINSHNGGFHELSFSLRGKGTLAQVSQLLYEFYQAGYLHKIVHLQLIPLASSGQFELSAAIEALSMPSAIAKSQLPEPRPGQLASDNLSDYSIITRRDIFGFGGEDSIARTIHLSAITTDGYGQLSAWFRLEKEVSTRILSVGDALVKDSLQATVIEIRPESVIVEIGGQRRELSIGQTLADRPAAATAALSGLPSP